MLRSSTFIAMTALLITVAGWPAIVLAQATDTMSLGSQLVRGWLIVYGVHFSDDDRLDSASVATAESSAALVISRIR